MAVSLTACGGGDSSEVGALCTSFDEMIDVWTAPNATGDVFNDDAFDLLDETAGLARGFWQPSVVEAGNRLGELNDGDGLVVTVSGTDVATASQDIDGFCNGRYSTGSTGSEARLVAREVVAGLNRRDTPRILNVANVEVADVLLREFPQGAALVSCVPETDDRTICGLSGPDEFRVLGISTGATTVADSVDEPSTNEPTADDFDDGAAPPEPETNASVERLPVGPPLDSAVNLSGTAFIRPDGVVALTFEIGEVCGVTLADGQRNWCAELEGGQIASLDWSPSWRRAVFATTNTDIAIVDTTTSAVTVIVDEGVNDQVERELAIVDGNAVWIDENRVAFMRFNGPNDQPALVIATADGLIERTVPVPMRTTAQGTEVPAIALGFDLLVHDGTLYAPGLGSLYSLDLADGDSFELVADYAEAWDPFVPRNIATSDLLVPVTVLTDGSLLLLDIVAPSIARQGVYEGAGGGLAILNPDDGSIRPVFVDSDATDPFVVPIAVRADAETGRVAVVWLDPLRETDFGAPSTVLSVLDLDDDLPVSPRDLPEVTSDDADLATGYQTLWIGTWSANGTIVMAQSDEGGSVAVPLPR